MWQPANRTSQGIGAASVCAILLSSLGILHVLPAEAATECFLYDELGRLKKAVHTDAKQVAYDLDAAGNRENLNTTTPADSTAPSAPSGLVATAISSSQIDLTWIGATDNTCAANHFLSALLVD